MKNQKVSRREALGLAVAVTTIAAAPLGLSASALASTEASGTSGHLPLKLAGYPVDRVSALRDGRVSVEGCDATYELGAIGDLNTDVFGGKGNREVTEIGLSPFMHAVANEGFTGYSLIPVFPLRLFRHKSIFIRPDRGIERPQDLRGKKVATPGYSSTSLTWIRGIMQHQYGVKPDEIQWYMSSKDSSAKDSGTASAQESIVPDGINVTMGPAGKDESDMLVDGDVDALFHAAQPRAFLEGRPEVVRLFPDYRSTERDYFSSTGIFPIMHAVAVRDDLIEANPWLTGALFDAYSASKLLAYKHLQNAAWYQEALPWVGQEFEETRALMGENYWPYGIEANRKTLEALFAYSYEQGLASRLLTVEELFHPSTLEFTES